jgi:UDP-glucose 4-epimerase
MRCLVTGGLGFIGSHLVDRLRALGHEVSILDDLSSAAVPIPASNLFRPVLVEGEWTESREDYSYEWIFHLAAVSRTPWAIKNPVRCNRVNVQGSLTVMKFARLTKARLVLASSNIVYGSPNPYKASKIAMEQYAEAYRDLYGLNVITLRYSNVYGPRMRWDDPICLAAMRRSAREKGYIELTGDGTQSRDFTHVQDIVNGTIKAAESDYIGDPIDLCTGQTFSMEEMALCFGVPIHYVPDRPGDTKHIVQDPEPARDILKWVSTIDVEDGIADVIDDVPVEVVA